MKRGAQQVIRLVHRAAFHRELPEKVALYFHDLAPGDHDKFAALMHHFVAREGYRLTTPIEFIGESPGRKLLITFDDNYFDWYDARRLFDQLNMRATFYVNTLPFECTAGSSTLEGYYDRIRHTGRRIPLDHAALQALKADGHNIGAHTHSHHDLGKQSEAEAREEILRSKQILEELVGGPIVDFAYPYGMRRHFSASLRATCLATGFATIANGIPGMLYAPQRAAEVQRSPWHFHHTLERNLTDLRIDGRWFTRLTGRSAVG